MRLLSAVMDADRGCRRSGVRRSSGRSSVERRAAVALASRRAPPGASTAASSGDSSRPSVGREPVWRVEEDEIVCLGAPRVRCARNARASCAAHLGRSAPSRARRGWRGAPRARPARARRTTACAAPRESASMPSAPRAGEQVEHALRRRAGRGARTAPRARGRSSGACASPWRRRQAAPAVACRRRSSRRGSGRAPRRRRRRRARRPSSACSGSPRSGSAARSSAARARARSSSSRVLGQPRDAELRAAPDWRVPISSPSLRSSRSISREPEAVAVRGERLQPRGVLGPEQQAQRRVLAAPDPPAQLVQLARCRSARRPRRASRSRSARRSRPRSPSSRRARRRRRRRTRPSPPASRAGAAGRAAARRGSPLNSPSRRRSNSARRPRLRLQRLGLLHERADDERLAAGAQLLADALVGARALALAAGDVRLDRPAAARQLAQRV